MPCSHESHHPSLPQTHLHTDPFPKREEEVFRVIQSIPFRKAELLNVVLETDWKYTAIVCIASQNYGVEINLPFNCRDDIIWRGRLTNRWLEANGNIAVHFGDMEKSKDYILDRVYKFREEDKFDDYIDALEDAKKELNQDKLIWWW